MASWRCRPTCQAGVWLMHVARPASCQHECCRRRSLAAPWVQYDAGRSAAIAASSVCRIQFPDADDGIAGCGKDDCLIPLATLRAKLCVARKFDPKKKTLP